MAPEVGATENRYEILAKLAEGGMAEIYLARGTGVGGVERHVVLKRILRELASDAELVKMFLDEARLAAQLQHPNVAQVYDVGLLGDSYFFTMEYVHGETVRGLIAHARDTGTPIPIGCALAIAVGAAAGLHHAHQRKSANGQPLGIVHRDVSPSNLMVMYEGHTKVVDFGIAKAANRAQKTTQGVIKGKLCYMAPEQLQQQRADRRSDLFSLGIVLWEMLTGEPLYHRDTDYLTLTAIVEEPPQPPSSVRRDVPREVDELVLHLLAKDPARRPQSGGELVEALEHIDQLATPSKLGRLMREWFGDKSEPWVELAAKPSIVTVMTNVPTPVDELALRAVPTMMLRARDDDARPTLVQTTLPGTANPTPVTVFARKSAPAASVPAAKPVSGKRRGPPLWAIAGAAVLASGLVVLAIARPWQSPSSAPVPPPQIPVAATAPADAAHAAVDAAVVLAPDASPDAALDTIAAAIATGSDPDVIAACAADRDRLAEHVEACVLAACRRHDARAKKWRDGARPELRPRLDKACPAVAPRRHVDECATDPLACQQ